MDTSRTRKIRAELALLGINQSEIARKLGVSSQMVSQVVAGRAISARVTKALIAAGVPENLFKEGAA